MANIPTTGFGPPPIATPITGTTGDQFGVPFQNRPDAPVPAGNLAVGWGAWFNALYARSGQWVRMVSSSQSGLSALAATLGPGDAGLLVDVTDYGHILQWTGSAWGWGPGETGSGMMVLFEVDPTATGWHLYDGSTVNYLKSDGTLGSVTLPNLAASAAYTKAGSPNSGPNAAVAPTFTDPTVSSVSAGTPSGSVGPIAAPNAGNVVVQSGSGATVAGSLHTHAAPLFAGSALPGHTHTLSGGGVSADGEPANIVRRPWFRQ